jgi:sugar (pentulose or hexulose) kinase
MRVESAAELGVPSGIRVKLGSTDLTSALLAAGMRPADLSYVAGSTDVLTAFPIPEDLITNVAFGGPGRNRLYITAGKTLYRFPVNVSGHAAYPPPDRK